MKRLFLLTVVLLCSTEAWSQLTLGNGHHVLEITGSLSTYYNHRVLKETSDNRNKDRFRLRDAQIQLEGRIKDVIEYELQVDFVDLSSLSGGAVDPENPGLMDAWIRYKGLGFVDVQVGYGKLFYSRSSLVPFTYSPYWQRAELLRGDVFGRRDIGVTLTKSLWRQRINVYAGVYTGLAEVSLRGDNDASGAPEYVARVDFAYPARYRYRDIDTRNTPIPMFAVGFNGRYANKQLPDGRSFPNFSTGEYGLKVINGERYVYGMDASFQYKGFSAQFEIHQMWGIPQRNNDALLHGYYTDRDDGFFVAGGYVAQVNYFSRKFKTIMSVRFEELDLNDLIPGNGQRLSGALAYQIKGFDSMIKFQYFNVLREESINPYRWTEQFRIGWQFNFK